MDRVFDNHVMANLQAVVGEHLPFITEKPDPMRIDRAKGALSTIYSWLDTKLPDGGWACRGWCATLSSLLDARSDGQRLIKEQEMTATQENGWELSVTRHIAAPPEKVWVVMANRIDEWWCPKPWRAEFDKLERRAGGASTCTMYGPDGEVHPHPGTVLAWDEGYRFAFTDAIAGDLMPAGPFMIRI